MDCLFCKMVQGEIKTNKIYEDNNVLAFLDINPDSDGHTLIIPKKHFQDLDDIDEETILCIFRTAKKLKLELEEKLGCEGMSLLQNNGYVQEIKHFHLHLKPYYKGKKSIEITKHSEFIKDSNEIYNLLKK